MKEQLVGFPIKKVPDEAECVGKIVEAVITPEGEKLVPTHDVYTDPRTAEEILAGRIGTAKGTKACLATDKKYGKGYDAIFNKKKTQDPNLN